ncbi:short-chain fatty acid transporter [Gallaecimonas pentaromativorans]|uniref:Short-chain fatty acids transporter n=1 Tax=Gallaecimonas pentaromativorans TaxID=584787 RepID=A0A3N1PB57_9GAMM|nr:TIGR00366 family protein [Gallaecimonas pentaromativorans]MED5525771.1 TIGR00366 family protein [Pseudomonadota bacterium]ROQ24998.1 short-chain fatty acids transporter [Gallaecimonas pentaromativorans]
MGWLVKGAVRMVERYLPDPFVLVLLLTMLVLGLSIGVQGMAPMNAVDVWGKGFWNLLSFAMQMALILVLGHLVASTPPVRKALGALARRLPGPKSAIVTVTLVALVASWLNWGFGLVVGAFFARAIAREIAIDYKLLVASAYSGFLIWHAGLSGSIPLTINTPGNFTEKQIGLIPTSETIFASYNLIIVVALLIVMPLLNMLMLDKSSKLSKVQSQEEENRVAGHGPMLNQRWPMYLGGAIMLAYLVPYFMGGGGLNLNVLNLVFLMLAMVLFGTASRFLGALPPAVASAGGILIQFPFYAGIMALMQGSGLATRLAEFFVHVSTADTLPLWSFLSAGLINLFVPSGGGQWAVQAPVMLPAAQMLHVDVAKVAMSVAWGDAWTNLLQPFWALPVLAIAGLGAKDVMGYCLIQLLVSGVVIGLGLSFL